MTLITILITLLMERYLQGVSRLQNMRWCERYFQSLHQQLGDKGYWDGIIGALILLLIPVVLVQLIELILASSFTPLAFVWDIAVLLVTLQGRALYLAVKGYSHSSEEEGEAPFLNMASALNVEEVSSEACLRGLLLEAHERAFGVLFWYLILGPAGAILYRLSAITPVWAKGASYDESSELYLNLLRIQRLLAWPSSRLVALGYGLSGSFVDFWAEMKLSFFTQPSRDLLICGGLASLRISCKEEKIPEIKPEDFRRALDMLLRTLVLGISILALMTLSGWLL